MKKKLNTEGVANELKGHSAFFPDYKVDNSPTPPAEHSETVGKVGSSATDGERVPVPVPPGVPPPVRGTVPRTPKVKRAIRQRQPFDIFEDQYLRLKQIAEAEREFEDGRGMSQMVREAIDMYLKKEHSQSNE
jgi:hypothetical protein